METRSKIAIAVVLAIAVIGGGSLIHAANERAKERAAIELQERKEARRKEQCEELHKMFDGSLNDAERTNAVAVAGNPEALKQFYIFICKERTNYWGGKVKEWLEAHDNLKKLRAADPEGYDAYIQTSEMRGKHAKFVERGQTFKREYDSWLQLQQKYEAYQVD